MKSILKHTPIAMLLTLVAQPSHSQDLSTRISPADQDSSGCDLAVPGIDKVAFLNFFPKLKTAIDARDFELMNPLVIYPLRVNSKPSKTIKNALELKKYFPSVFSAKIISAISKQELKKLFCRDQGVMIGDGEVWITQKGTKVGISIINP